MKNIVLLLLSVIFLSSCRLSYYYPSSVRVDKVLGVTQEGDTIQVPIDYFEDRAQRQYDFNLEYFYWRNDWFFYNPNIYNRRWFVNNWWWNPYTHWSYPTYIQRQRTQQPRRWRTKTNIQQRRRNEVQPKRRTPQVQPNRGRSNQQTRKPQYVRPNTRSRVTTPPPTHSNRNSTVRRSNTNTRTKNN